VDDAELETLVGSFRSIEMCAGAGGQALGLELAGFTHDVLVEIDPYACRTLRANRDWSEIVLEQDITKADFVRHAAKNWRGVDLLAGGVPCPPFSIAGKQLGPDDERDLFPAMIELARVTKPRAVLIENVRGILTAKFGPYRLSIEERFARIGLKVVGWQLLEAKDFGVPQLRPRVAMVAFREAAAFKAFEWPQGATDGAKTVASELREEMGSRGWLGLEEWCQGADSIAPTLVGGSKKHGGPDLGPTRARRHWATLGVNGSTLALEPPEADFLGQPRLTVKMTGILQGFPSDWEFVGSKTQTYRQVGNAFPPPVARALGEAIKSALEASTSTALRRRASRDAARR
jgi:DNA (cytosine-5)-methyltransferase 1